MNLQERLDLLKVLVLVRGEGNSLCNANHPWNFFLSAANTFNDNGKDSPLLLEVANLINIVSSTQSPKDISKILDQITVLE